MFALPADRDGDVSAGPWTPDGPRPAAAATKVDPSRRGHSPKNQAPLVERCVENDSSAHRTPVAFLATRASPADVAFAPNRLTYTFDRPVNRSLGRLTLVQAENGARVKREPSPSA